MIYQISAYLCYVDAMKHYTKLSKMKTLKNQIETKATDTNLVNDYLYLGGFNLAKKLAIKRNMIAQGVSEIFFNENYTFKRSLRTEWAYAKNEESFNLFKKGLVFSTIY